MLGGKTGKGDTKVGKGVKFQRGWTGDASLFS